MAVFSRVLKDMALPLARVAAPKAYLRYKFGAIGKLMHEQEIHLLPLLCDPNKKSLDVGASGGIYTARLVKLSSEVVAFEPRVAAAAQLAALVEATGSRVTVEAVALSDTAGHGRLRVLDHEVGRSTIEVQNELRGDANNALTEVAVTTRVLDDYGYVDVGFIKIDVEGHELAVLGGARRTLLESQPAVLVEAEDRHRPNAVRDVSQFFDGLSYAGYFLLNGRLQPLADFDVTIHQDPRNVGGAKDGFRRFGVHVNNFIFVPEPRARRFEQDVDRTFPDGVPEIG